MGALEASRVREIESLVHGWLQDEEVPGASVVLVDPDGERYAEGFGARDLETNAPATPDTLYGMGSVTKAITGLAVVDLAEQGHLSLSDPVDQYVDHYADAPGEPITLAALLSHTSGMPATTTGLLAQALRGQPAGVADERDRERLVRAASEYRLTGQERFFYYNTGYDVLGRVVEAVDGRQYADYVREEFFEPLEMDRSTFHRDEFEAEEDRMTGYEPGEDVPKPTALPFEELIHPSGGLVSSVRELGQFVRAAMTDGAIDGTRIASAAAIEQCQQSRTVRHRYLDGSEEQYGYGWMRHPLGDGVLVGHGGSLVVSTAYAGFLADAQLGVVVACNTTVSPHPMELGGAILAVATGDPPTTEPAFALDAKCEAVTGAYESFRGAVTATVERASGGIAVTLSASLGEEEFTAFPESLDPDEHTFYTVGDSGAREPVEFDLGGDQADLFYGRSRFRRE